MVPHRLLIVLGAFVCLAAGQPVVKPKVETPVPAPRRHETRPVGIVPGRISVELGPSLWTGAFTVDDKRGLTRLRSGTALSNLLRCFVLERVWRTFPQVEWTSGKSVRVISYDEWYRRTREGRPMRPNQRAAQPPHLPDAANHFEMKFSDVTDVSDLVARLRKIPGVISANIVQRPPVTFTPNDPGWVAPGTGGYDANLERGRWGFRNTGAALGAGYLANFDIDAPDAWDIQRGDPNVVVAVFDTNIDVTHPDLYLNVFLNNGEVPPNIVASFKGASARDGLPNELTFYDLNEPAVVTALAAMGYHDTNGNGYIDAEDVVAWWSNNDDADHDGFVDDLVGWNFVDGNNRPFSPPGSHGTGSAGLIAAMADNALGIAGVAHHVRILPVSSAFTVSEITYAEWFSQVRVINHSMSSWFQESNATVDSVMKTLDPEGILYICSLGNRDAFYFGADPSRWEEVMSISNFGPNGIRGVSGHGPKTDVAGPGDGEWSLDTGGRLQEFCCTSAASPMVAGVAALTASQSPARTPEQLRQTLRMTAADPAAVAGDRGENTPGWDLYSGWGLVNAKNALDALVAGKVFPAAKIISPMKNFEAYPKEEFSIGTGTVPIFAIVGTSGSMVNWTLKRSASWDLSNPTVVASGATAFLDGSTPLTSIATDALDGRQVLELQVTAPTGEVSRDRAVIDLPRAYISNLVDGQPVMTTDVEGLAYGPGFNRFRIQVAPGWTPAATAFVDVSTRTTPVAPALSAQAGYESSPGVLLASLDTSALPITVPASRQITLRVQTEGTRTWTYDVNLIASPHPPIRTGFPKLISDWSRVSPTAADIDGDGIKEIVTGGNGFGCAVDALRPDGTHLPGFPVQIAGEVLNDSPAVGDVDGDGRPEIVIRTQHPSDLNVTIRVIRSDGTIVNAGFPLVLNTNWAAGSYRDSPPVLGDIDGDGRLDILAPVNRPTTATLSEIRAIDGGTAATIRSFQGDPDINSFSPPAVGDLDRDGRLDVVAIGGRQVDSVLYAWRNDGTVMWKVVLPSSIDDVGPMLLDIDGDGQLEVIAGSRGNYLRVYSATGTQIAFQAPPPYYRAGLSAVQFDPSAAIPAPALLYGEQTGQTAVHALAPSTLTELTGWPVTFVANLEASGEPVAADFLEDARLEVGYGNGPPSWAVTQPIAFGLARVDGTLVANAEFPIRLNGPIDSTALVSDLDNDGHPELVIQTDAPDNQLYAFNLSGSTHSAWVSWGEFRHDPKKTANYHADLHILSPSTIGSQHVGAFNDPTQQSALLVRVQFSRGAPADDLNASRWHVTIGGTLANVSDVQHVQGEHWLIVDPVVQAAAGAQMLRVEFDDGGIRTWDSYAGAVVYDAAAVQHSTIPVIDVSGSMATDGKIEAARTAARFFAQSAYAQDEVGAVAFSDTAMNLLGTASLLPAGANRATITSAIDSITPIATTSIGAGLTMGLDLMTQNANPANPWSLVLLTDGLENEPPFWNDPGGSGPVRPRAAALAASRDFRIHTVALGPDADQALVEQIADATGGTYYAVALGHSLSMLNRLADVYHSAREQIDGTQRLFTSSGDLSPAATKSGRFAVPAGARRLQIALNWDQSASVTLRVFAPGGRPVVAGSAGVTWTQGPTDNVVTIAMPDPGEWNVTVSNAARAKIEFLLVASAALPTRIGAVILPKHLAADIVAFVLGPKGLVRDATITATVTLPTKETFDVRLRSSDGGIVRATVPFTQPGSYMFTLQAAFPSGVKLTLTKGRFNRDATDRDADGIPDSWERRALPCGILLNPRDDPDGDGRTNSQELHRGTNPFSRK